MVDLVALQFQTEHPHGISSAGFDAPECRDWIWPS
jgi:hypothetical protein